MSTPQVNFPNNFEQLSKTNLIQRIKDLERRLQAQEGARSPQHIRADLFDAVDVMTAAIEWLEDVDYNIELSPEAARGMFLAWAEVHGYLEEYFMSIEEEKF